MSRLLGCVLLHYGACDAAWGACELLVQDAQEGCANC